MSIDPPEVSSDLASTGNRGQAADRFDGAHERQTATRRTDMRAALLPRLRFAPFPRLIGSTPMLPAAAW
jgi:hypothetical protein